VCTKLFLNKILRAFIVSPILALSTAHFSFLYFAIPTILGGLIDPEARGYICNIINYLIISSFLKSSDSSVGTCWATGWTIGVQGFDSRRELGIFLFTAVSRTALGPIQPPIQWIAGALSLR
jgi:hypothetical protein